MKRGSGLYVGLIVLMLVLGSGCAGTTGGQATTATPAPGDPVIGAQLFQQTLRLTGAPNCASCHVVSADELAVVGPSLAGIGTAAATRSQAQSAEEYLERSIVAPNEYIVPGYPAGVMPRTYEVLLTEQQRRDIVAYMLTLK